MRINNIIFIIVSLFISNIAFANQTVQVKHFKDLKKISLKCYVELIGGRKIVIQHHNLPEKSRNKFEERLITKGISGGKNSRKIYKVIECTKLNHKFKDSIAENLYEEMNENG